MMNVKKKTSGKPRRSAGERVGTGIAFTIFVLYAAFILFFFLFAFLIAIKENQQAFVIDQIDKRLFRWPEHPTLRHFLEVFSEWSKISEGTSYGTMLFNSVWISLIGPFIASFVTATVTYILVFYRSKFTGAIYKAGVFLAILPIYGATSSMYKLLSDIGFIDSPLMFLTNITLYGANFFYFYAFYKSISWQYAEAAFIDGAGHWQVYLKIMLPMLIPSATALYIMGVIGMWNDYETILLYWQSYPTLAYGAYAFEEIARYSANDVLYFAGVLMSVLPILVLFAIFQNTIMEKVHIGGLKG